MLEKQVYPDLRIFPGGPPEPPYDVTGHTLWMLMGVNVQAVEKPFEASLERMKAVAPVVSPLPPRPKAAYLVGPESYGVFKLVAELQKASVPTFRAGTAFEGHPAGTFIIPSTPASQAIVEKAAPSLGLVVAATDRMPAVDGFRLKPGMKVGMWKAAGNMPAGWLMWQLEQYGIDHEIVKAQDFTGDLNQKYDVILLPSGTSKARIVNGLDPKRNDAAEWSWAYGVGESGWAKLRTFVQNGGTMLAIGSAVETTRELLDLPIEKALPEAPPRFGASAPRADDGVAAGAVERALRDAFSSPARLMQTLRDRVADPTSLFYCPGSLLQNEFDTSNPVAWGMPEAWPVFFETDQAYRLRPGFRCRDQSRVALSARAHPAERVAAGRGVPEGPGEHSLVPHRQGLRRHLWLAGGLPDAAARDVPVDLQRAVPRAVDARDGRADGALSNLAKLRLEPSRKTRRLRFARGSV